MYVATCSRDELMLLFCAPLIPKAQPLLTSIEPILHAKCCSKHFTCINSLNPHTSLWGWHYPHFTGEETVIQQCEVTCSKWHNNGRAGTWTEAARVWCTWTVCETASAPALSLIPLLCRNPSMAGFFICLCNPCEPLEGTAHIPTDSPAPVTVHDAQ